MDCCSHARGLNKLFNQRIARAEVRQYLKHGIDKHARKIVEALVERSVEQATVLEVGGGIGGLHAELIKRGAAQATDVDISRAYIEAAGSLAQRLGIREQIEYREADFASAADEIPPADVVVMHRVVCCYPDMPALVTAAADHANRLMAFSFPHDAWYMRIGRQIFNAVMWLQRSGYRFYVHEPAAIQQVAGAAGFAAVYQQRSWPWRIVVFERR